MATARTRASFTDDDSNSDHLSIEMVRMNATATTIPSSLPAPTTSTNRQIELDEQTILDDSIGTTNAYDLLSQNNIILSDGIQREYEIPNVFTFKKVNDGERGEMEETND